MKPIGDQIIIKPDNPETKSKGGIFLPGNSQERPTLGVVVAVGRGHLLESGTLVPLEVSEGDRVAFKMYGGTEAEIAGETYLVVSEKDILFSLPSDNSTADEPTV